jgi:hypothetical protein
VRRVAGERSEAWNIRPGQGKVDRDSDSLRDLGEGKVINPQDFLQG